MNSSPNNFVSNPLSREAHGPGEDTLRLIASLPAPAGLSDRIQAGLRAAPQPRRTLMRHEALRPPFGWMYSGMVRCAAAAAIVCVVAGGGWKIYSHAQPEGAAKMIVSPSGNGFSTAGAKRVPQTLDGPVLTHPVANPPEVNVMQKMSAQPKPASGPATIKSKRVRRTTPLPVQ